ncbi:excisionase family DNA binding domain-containing protein [Actinobaculum suis]|uniref:Excisionase family DNA binding domain-containing protein n=1 Tax=Actinobaculum suis TaxID=1657 RepID=A0A7Z8YAK1_9ACTO|nr:excisionase family DNA binding domain-containing protein [Actinobaculum suis]
MSTQTENLLSVKQVAEKVGVREGTVRRWLLAGDLQGVRAGRLWRIRPYDLDKFLESTSR